MMQGRDIRIWRQDRKLTLAQLAKHLGKSRNTIWNWENGKTPIPVNMASQLETLAYTTAPKPVDVAPTIITPTTCPRLYAKDRPGRWAKRGIHPASLVDTGFLDPAVLDGALKTDHSWQHVPFAVLEDPRYLDAVARWNASGRRVGGDMI